MNLALTVPEITAPVFSWELWGGSWVKAGFDYPTEFVTGLAMMLAVMLAALSLAAALAYATVALASWDMVKVRRLRS